MEYSFVSSWFIQNNCTFMNEWISKAKILSFTVVQVTTPTKGIIATICSNETTPWRRLLLYGYYFKTVLAEAHRTQPLLVLLMSPCRFSKMGASEVLSPFLHCVLLRTFRPRTLLLGKFNVEICYLSSWYIVKLQSLNT